MESNYCAFAEHRPSDLYPTGTYLGLGKESWFAVVYDSGGREVYASGPFASDRDAFIEACRAVVRMSAGDGPHLN